MTLVELFILAVGLSMDACAVSICKGLSMDKMSVKSSAIVGLWFGGFQALMPLLGFFLGTRFKDYITSFDHWVAFILLGLIGANMIKEALSSDDECVDCSLSFSKMFPLAIATSIDALAVGITFAFLSVDIVPAVTFIGVVTFILSAIGVCIGNIFGAKYKSKAEFFGGLILIILGTKILLEHLNIL